MLKKWWINLGFTLWLVSFYRSSAAHAKVRSTGKQRTVFPVCRFTLTGENCFRNLLRLRRKHFRTQVEVEVGVRRSCELFSDLTSLFNSIRILNYNQASVFANPPTSPLSTESLNGMQMGVASAVTRVKGNGRPLCLIPFSRLCLRVCQVAEARLSETSGGYPNPYLTNLMSPE